MPYDPDSLPDLTGDYRKPNERLQERLDALAAILGSGFDYKGGLRYRNDSLEAVLNNRMFRARMPFMGGTLEGSVKDLENPYYQLLFRKSFK